MSLEGSLTERLDPKKAKRLLKDLDRVDSNESLLKFIDLAWHVLEPKREFVPGWHIEAVCEHLEAVHDKEISRLLINVPPGCMKPGSIENIVATSTGRKRLGDIVVGDFVLTHRGRYRKVKDVHKQGVLPLLRITTHSGRVSFAAYEHPYLTPRGWVAAEDLNVDDFLGAVSPIEDAHKDTVSLKEARALGYIIGDGSVTQPANTLFTNKDEGMVDDFRECVTSLGFDTSQSKYDGKDAWVVRVLGGKCVQQWLKKHNLDSKSSYTKRIPDTVLSSTREVIKNFLGAYWSCDGNVHVRDTRKRNSIYRSSCTTVSEGLAKDLLHVLGRVGIRARVRKRSRTLTTKAQLGGKYVYWTVDVQNETDTARIMALPGLTDRKKFVCRERFDSVLWEDRIVEIIPVEPNECRCLTVEEDHSFTWDDIAVHNSMTTDVFFPAWEWGPRNSPGIRYVSASYSEALTIRDNRRCRNLLRSSWYQDRWGTRFNLVGDQNAKVKYETNHSGFKIATSVGGLGTGERGDRFIIDDPHNVIEGESDAKRTAVLRWFTESVTTRVNDPETSAIIVIMQRVHDKDVSGHILANEMGYTHLMLPMEFEPDRRCKTYFFRDPRKEEGELLWPERMSAEVIDRDKRAMGSYAVAAQFQQTPTPRGGGMFKRQWFEIVEAAPANGTVVRGWDLAASETISAAFTSGVKMRRDPEGIFYIEDVVRFRGSPGKVDQALVNTASNDGYMTRQDIPQDPGQAGKSQVKYFSRLLAGYNVRSSTETGSKETRAEPFSAQAEAGNVKLVRGLWNDLYLDELCLFPFSDYKDQVDASSRSFSALIPKRNEDQIPQGPEVVTAHG